MKIELKEPYKSLYKFGRVVIDKRTNRKILLLTKFDGGTTVTSYARYIYAVSTGAMISPLFDVDHINNDRTDDRIENLQLLTKVENIAKYHKHYRDNNIKFVDIKCEYCNKIFKLSESEQRARIVNNKSYNENSKFYCSISCLSESQRFSSEIQKRIKELDKKDIYSSEIARLLDIDVSAVIRYRKNLPTHGLGIKITDETIDKINSFDPNIYSNKEVARLLNIGKNSVVKYRTRKATEGMRRRLDNSVFKEIETMKKDGKSNAEIGRVLNIDASTISRFSNGKYSKKYY